MKMWFMFWYALLVMCVGCEAHDTQEVQSDYFADNEALVAECGGVTRYPTSEVDFARLYAGRSFLVSGGPGAHLGRDILYPEGTAIKPIMCGRIVYYGPATGYGSLVVAIEHRLNRAVSITNGDGVRVMVTTFLSLYGHLRTSATLNGAALPWRVNMSVSPNDTIGYVQSDAHNGDGAEHLHMGIRLQSAADAQQSDGRYWLRGYDSPTSRRGYFAEPVGFLRQLANAQQLIGSHPAGTYLVQPDGQGFVIAPNGSTLLQIDRLTADREGYVQRAIPAEFEQVNCYLALSVYRARFSDQPGRRPFIGRSQSDPAVSLFYGDRQGGYHRDTFVSWEALLSHGYVADQIGWFDASEWSILQRNHPLIGVARLQEGSLVKAREAPAIYVVSNGRRRPIFNWNTFQAMGYELKNVYSIPAATLDAVAGPLGPVLRLEEATTCRARGI